MGSLTGGQRRSAAGGVASAASLGIAAVHECGGPGTSSEDDFAAVLALGGELPEVYGYWGELVRGEARELGARAGDVRGRGLGSQTRTAAAPYGTRRSGTGT